MIQQKEIKRHQQHDLPEYSLSPFRVLLPAQSKVEIGREGVPPAVANGWFSQGLHHWGSVEKFVVEKEQNLRKMQTFKAPLSKRSRGLAPIW